ncbi:MAG: T9SS type A sorting domain-containing protein, partial [Spirochaetaceae bacterium]|nr:T9SS type A sorting domain-containing protein [Spirochaetaceae bacterium]
RDKAGLQDVKPGIARIYDGSETIRNTDITVENIRAADFAASPPLILFDVNIPDQYKASLPDFTSNIGLWLTSAQAKSGLRPPYLNMVPKEVPNSQLKTVSSTDSGGRYFMTIPEKDLPDSSLLEFIYAISNPAKSPALGPLYGARVNGTQSGLPEDWFNRLDSFKINVRGITYQRSGATILSNVINPTKGEKAVLNYELSRGGQVTVQVFTLDGVLIQTLFRGSRSAGEYVASWDGKNKGGNVVARGMYFVRIVAPDIDEIRKVMVVK